MNQQGAHGSERWWLAQPGQAPMGPFPWTELVRRVNAAGGPGSWMACAEGTAAWRAIATDPELCASFRPMPPPPPATPGSEPGSPANTTSDQNLIVFIHLGVLAGFIVPILGLVLPLVLWLTNRARPDVERAGKEVANWLLFTAIASLVSLPFVFCYIGFLMLFAIAVAMLVCAIIGAVKASRGEFFSYPMPFRLIK